MFTCVMNRTQKGAELRDVMVESIGSLMDADDRVLALEADLGDASRFTRLAKTHPGKLIQCGISEANMVGVAAGLSSEGFHPFLHTFGPFATRRCFDQIFLSGAYAKNTLTIYGSDPGFCVGTNGGTHTTWEDMALMRSIPGALVCDPADEVQLRWLVSAVAQRDGISYIRANRKAVRNLYEQGSTFELGRANCLRTGDDVLLVAEGQLVSDALDAAEELSAAGIGCTVLDMFCIKPLDEAAILEHAENKRLVVTFENHGVIGGMGEAVAAVMAEHALPARLVRMGVHERFGQVGNPDWLQAAYGLTATDVVRTVKEALA
ncbi:alpha-ketoacid dehydrogenase subunit beta [Collinsella sp. AGMB00827]|uniref:Alpha-ketoacid dehydrogenase subunit beta n=1 Tax=Collinsella ureilytica TaxID=2869515 RepID=A0ABS7MJE3_9ACTN|nr:transketolase C-terminal domain-containing protein [Collinsella urealyticum]MBY4797200.1 alpha-ketoacid dehydrogenase subunit beta [Collinsella urealyticum]